MKTVSKCKGCDQPIIWIKTVEGKNMPCDAGEVLYWPGKKDRIVTLDGQVLPCSLTGERGRAIGIGYIPHWATCPKRWDFKGKGKE